MHVVTVPRPELYKHAQRIMERAHASDSPATRRFLLESVALIDGALATPGDPVEVRGRLGWLRMIGLATAARDAVDVSQEASL